MAHDFKVRDLRSRSSRGTINKRIVSEIKFKGYTVHASKEEPQYLIKRESTDRLAMHTGSALKKLKKNKE